MNPWQEALYQTLGLIVIHTVAAVYFSRRERKAGGTGQRSTVIMAGNCLLLILFYVPSKIVPKAYLPFLFVGFWIGFMGLLRLVQRLPKSQEPPKGDTDGIDQIQ